MNIWQAQGKAIVVGLLLDGHEQPFLKSICTLAARLHSPIELVHCLDAPVMDASKTKERMNALVRSIDAGIVVRCHVEYGDPIDHLCRIAEAASAGLIACGTRSREHRSLQGLSTALSLALYATTPVLLLPLTTTIDFQAPVNILISDSFGGTSWQTLENGLRVACSLESPLVGHAHVLNASPQKLDDEGGAADGALRIQEELFYRFHNTTSAKVLLDRYRPLGALRDLKTEIDRMIEVHHFHLLVVGRGQFHLKNKLLLNHLPYHAVAEGKVGLLILTNEDASLGNDDRREADDFMQKGPSQLYKG